MSKNLSELSGRKGLTKNLFEELGAAAKRTGTPSAAEMEKLADEFLIGRANVYGTASFYDFLHAGNKGKKVYTCNGSSCLTAGTQDALKKKLSRHFKKEEIGEMCCMGRCHENHSFHYKGLNYSGKDIAEIAQIRKGKYKSPGAYSTGHLGTPVLTAPFPGIENFYALLGPSLKRGAGALLEELKISGLRGRGGAGFPLGMKLESCKNTEGKIKFIVCNADEGDPGAYSDRYLLEQRPHSLLLGMLLAGFITGATTGVIYIRTEYPEAIAVAQQAIDDIRSAGFTGTNILASGFDFDFKIIRAAGAYICGEETALLSSIEGQRPEVRVRPPYPTQQGLFNKPTVVNNVETLACIPYVIRNGGKAFASLGKGRSTGTKLVSLDGFFKRAGVYEVEMGTPLKEVFQKCGGGLREKIKAFHIGGPLGGLVPASRVKDLTLDFESFTSGGFLLGHASVVCLPADFPVIDYIEHLFRFTAHESCGKCFPCRLGSTRGYELVNKAKEEDYKIDRTLMNDLLETMETGSLCALGGGLPLPVRNALQYFEKELKPYFKK
ncbi:MAG: NAD(P)H-dependent oxidoreductase subunit E [Bacteroidia bacterium]|nr:NAD(P)H-dependent oxidoreductase subunit E [Bacteroidia bacterium]